MNNEKEMNMTELDLNEMEQVTGGGLWDRIKARAFEGGFFGVAAASVAIMVMSNPVGWAAAAGVVAAGAAIGAATGSGIGAVESAIRD